MLIFSLLCCHFSYGQKAQEQSTEVLVDLSDTLLNNYGHDVMLNHSDADPIGRENSEKQDAFVGSDVSLSNQN